MAIDIRDQRLTTLVGQQVRKYPSDEAHLARFLAEYGAPKAKYLRQLQDISDGQLDSLRIEMDDLLAFAVEHPPDDAKFDVTLPGRVLLNAPRYILLSYSAAEKVRAERCPPQARSGTAEDFYATLMAERGRGRLASMLAAGVPPHLRVPYDIRFVAPSDAPILTIRQVGAASIGNLVKLEGIVSKVSAVKPRITVAYYKCTDCGADCHQAVEDSAFTPSTSCQSATCKLNSRRKQGTLHLVPVDSKFVKSQTVRIQESPARVPSGAVPRSQLLTVEGSLTRIMLPGHTVRLSGVLMPVQKTGFAALRAGLITETQFVVHDVEVDKAGALGPRLDPSAAALWTRRMERLKEDAELYEKLARSVAPAIHGMEDVKKVLLLQLVGGVTEQFSDGMKIRGDIHVLLMGDPGVAKSQLLGQVCQLAPRAHFTTGKGSSGVGLTASVVRDSITGDLALEGGAIVLSDRGICCIDEFDKMDEYDRTAIHEVMEQQTVSISKAGLSTTLNARTAILAAANPQYGRYDVRKSPLQNINLPAALLSRFDVHFLLLDRADRTSDIELAKHVLSVHQKGSTSAPPTAAAHESALFSSARQTSTSYPQTEQRHATGVNDDLLEADLIRALVLECKKFKPKLPVALIPEVRDMYVEQRTKERDQRENKTNSTAAESLRAVSYTTPRALLAILRLSQALARLRLSDEIAVGDLEEARRLIHASRRSVEEELADADPRGRRRGTSADVSSALLELLKSLASKKTDGIVPWVELGLRAAQQGFTDAQLASFVNTYTELDVLHVETNKTSDRPGGGITSISFL